MDLSYLLWFKVLLEKGELHAIESLPLHLGGGGGGGGGMAPSFLTLGGQLPHWHPCSAAPADHSPLTSALHSRTRHLMTSSIPSRAASPSNVSPDLVTRTVVSEKSQYKALHSNKLTCTCMCVHHMYVCVCMCNVCTK